MLRKIALAVLLAHALMILVLTQAVTAAEEGRLLWQIGTPDHNTAKFAFGPKDYKSYRQPGFFVVGQSDAKKDWPYVQPGVIDGGWAPGGPQTFEIFFGLKDMPRDALTRSVRSTDTCRLELYFADTHSNDPPKVRVEVNGLSREYQTPPGAGDASVNGEPAKGRPHVIRLEVPAGTLKPGTNRIAITTMSGSWLLWDAVQFQSPAGVELTPVTALTKIGAGSAPPVLIERGGKLYHPVKLNISHVGQPVDATIEVAGAEPVAVALKAGTQEIELAVPAVEKKTDVAVVAKAAGKTLAEGRITLQPVRRRTFYVLMHSHVDIGYTDIQPNIAKKQVHNVLRALELIKATKDFPEGSRFKWNLEVYWPAQQFLAVATPEQKKEFEEAVRSGDIGIDAMHGNLLTGVCRAEELVRAFESATQLGRDCGVKVQSMMISDVPGLTWGIVPSLAQAGVKYISDGANAAGGLVGDRIGYVRVQWENKPFWWVSPSGRERVLYWGAQGGYSIGHHCHSIMAGVHELESALDGWSYPYDIVQLRWSKGDNGPADEAVMPAMRDWNAKYAWPKLIIATTAEAFAAFEKQYGDKLPEFRGDFTPYWEDGLASAPAKRASTASPPTASCRPKPFGPCSAQRQTIPAPSFVPRGTTS